MTDPVSVTATVITSLSSALDLLKIIRRADNANAVEQATRALNDYILKQNDRILTDSARIIELNDQCLRYKDKIIELEEELRRKSDYSLINIGSGFKAYVLKEASASTEEVTPHKPLTYFCTRCYDVDGKAVVLQAQFVMGSNNGLECPACKFHLPV